MTRKQEFKWYIISTIGFFPVLAVWIIAGLPKKDEILRAVTFSLVIFLLFFFIGWALHFLIRELYKNWNKFLLQERALRIAVAFFLILVIYALIVYLLLSMSP